MERFRSHAGGMLLLALLGVGLLGCPPNVDLVINLSPDNLEFGAAQETLPLQVSKNASSQPMPAVTVSSASPWIIAENCQSIGDGCVSTGPNDVISVPIRVDRDQMVLGPNTGMLEVEGAGLQAQTVQVSAVCIAVADFSADNRTPRIGEEVQFSNQSTTLPEAGNVLSTAWDFGDGTPVSSEASPRHAYAAAGSYAVSLTFTTAGRTALRVKNAYINVNAFPPVACFSVNPAEAFVGIEVAFDDCSTAQQGTITEWHWDFGDGDTSTEENPVHVYTAQGLYTVSLRVVSTLGEDTLERPNAVLVQTSTLPTARFRVLTSEPLANSPVAFEDQSTAGSSPITAYAWDFGDGSSSDQANPLHTYRQAGTYSVTLTVTTAHGSDTSSSALVHAASAPPGADFVIDPPRALTTDVVGFTDTSYTGTSPITSWTWDFGDPGSADNSSTEPLAAHRYAAPGTYSVSLTVTTAIGTDTETKTACVNVFEATALDRYVRTPDPSYDWHRGVSFAGDGYTVYVLQMTSQTWRTSAEVDHTLWTHWLTVIEPDTVSSDTALLYITGGDIEDDMPSLSDGDIQALALIAAESNSVTALLRQVPNEPLTFAGEEVERSEDAIIAYTFDKYMETGDETWPLLLPMVKSAVRAMDTVSAFHRDVGGGIVERFVISGASKRGWTTWLTAAVDPRVSAIAPMVIDVLNIGVQMAHHHEVYGYYSEAIYEYLEMDVFSRLDTPEGNALLSIVDPYEYRARLSMPKLLINSTGDEFFVPDSAQFYFGDLPGDNYLCYVPNTRHSLGHVDTAASALFPWYRAFLEGRSTPRFSWTIVEGEGRMIIDTDTTPLEVNLYSANAPNRDFRLDPDLNPAMPEWTKTTLSAAAPNRYVAQAPLADTGWTGFFVQMVFDSPYIFNWYPVPYVFTTEVRVLPDTVPPAPDGLPAADFTAIPIEPALNGEVTFTDASSSGDRPILRWYWDFGDGTFSYDQNPTHAYTTAAAFDVSLTVYTAIGQDTLTKPQYIAVQGAVRAPRASFTVSRRTGFAPLTVDFTDTSAPGSEPIASWLWNFGDGGTSSAQHPSYDYEDAGTYSVSLTVTSAAGTDTETMTNHITVSVAAVADFTVDNAAPAAFTPVHFQDASVGFDSAIQQWSWSFGDGGTSSQRSPSHTYTAMGSYTVTLTVTTQGGGDTEIKEDFIVVSSAPPTGLDEYIAAPDANYAYSLEGQPVVIDLGPYGSVTLHTLDMTSQKWRTEAEVDKPIWRHWLTIIEPESLVTNTALLVIAGGSNTSGAPVPEDWNYFLALQTGSVVAILQGVPSEPLRFSDETRTRSEDEIIAYTYDKFMKSVDAGHPDSTWPLLLPMTKSAIRAMDTVQSYLSDAHQGQEVVDQFVVAGGSKRGWTTWLTGSADPLHRVAGIIPMVIDVLNIGEQMAHHRAVYGYWAPSIYDYAQMRVFERLDTPAGEALLNLVDPFRRRDKLTMPKLLMNSTGDQFFVSDSARFYFDALSGPKYLNYMPNTDHGLNTETATIVSIAAFFNSVAQDLQRPQVSWSFNGMDTLTVQTDTAPSQASLWRATIQPGTTKGRRDFRLERVGPIWQRSSLSATAPGQYTGRVVVPPTGWTAFFVQLVYDDGYIFTTDIHVVPDTYPVFESYRTSIGSGTQTIPVCVLYGEPYDMGYDLGRLMASETQQLTSRLLEMAQAGDPDVLSNAALDQAWAITSIYMDDRFKDELDGIAEGSGVSITTMRRVHMIPVLGEYSCSSIAAWGPATANGHLLQTRDLDWVMELQAHSFPCIAMYIPDSGTPHVNITFAGYIGSQTGMNLGGIVLTEMGDSPGSDRPYDLRGNHFTVMFREILYDAMSLTEAIDIIDGTRRIKKYHYVIGDGRNELSAVKIQAHVPDPLVIWTDNDPADPDAPGNGGDGIAPGVVYNDEGRGAWPYIEAGYGSLTVDDMKEIAINIPIEGGNVMDVVYDATDTTMLVSYAEGDMQAYTQPFVTFDMRNYLP